MPASRDVIVKTITSAVEDRFRKDPDTLTVNSIRADVEERLELENGYLKSDAYWKDESRKLVQITVDKLNAEPEDDAMGSGDEKNEETKDEPLRPTPKQSRKPARRAAPSDEEAEFDESPPPQKKRKTAVTKKAPKSKPEPKRKAKALSTVGSSSELSEVDEQELLSPEPEAKKNIEIPTPKTPTKKEVIEEIHTSDLSEVDDPSPKRKVKSKREGNSKEKAASKSKAKAAPKEKKEKAGVEPLTPAEEKIKSLQNQLLKCGIRKIWSRELAQYSTSKEKIKHLEKILHDIGMTGRFSLEKAKAIKERRELEEEVAAVQEGAKDWGRSRGRLQTRSSLNTAKSSKPPPTNSALDEIDFLVDRSDSD